MNDPRYRFPTVTVLLAAALVVATPTIQAQDEEMTDPRYSGEDIAGLVDRVEELESTQGNFTVGGAAWLNYEYSSFKPQQRDRLGDFRFDLFRVEARGKSGPWEISAQYRWYEYMDVIHHAWIGYTLDSGGQIQAGISQVPFGLQPYASHSYWFGLPYYLGFEDDYQAGVKYVNDTGNWDLQMAYYANPALATPSANDRYAWNIVTADLTGSAPAGFEQQANRQNDQVNLRLATTLFENGGTPTEVGFSGQYGRLYNEVTEEHGSRYAAALHSRTGFGPDRQWGLELEWINYGFSPENPPGTSDDAVLYGAFVTNSLGAAEGNLYVMNLTRDFNVDWGPISNLSCYIDYSLLDKRPVGFEDSVLHTTGCAVSAGPTYTFVDIIRGKNHNFMPFSGALTAFAQGDPNAEWETRININMGIYF